jgi:transposase
MTSGRSTLVAEAHRWEAVQQRRGLGQSLRQIAHALGVDRRTVRAYLATDQRANRRLAEGYHLNTRFQTVLAERDVGALEPWLQQAEGSDLPSFHTVARSFRQDYAAITAALTTPWSNRC